jgi:hypothetical protein
MDKQKNPEIKSEFIIFKTEDQMVSVNVRFEEEIHDGRSL